jgi:very-short-patch-repair endonuclease
VRLTGPRLTYPRPPSFRNPQVPAARTVSRHATAAENLEALFPDLARQWHPTRNAPLRACDVRPKSNKKVWWRCTRNPAHEWEAAVNARHVAGCPRCNEESKLKHVELVEGQRVLRTLAMCEELFGELVASPSERSELGNLYVGSTRSLTWQCKAGHPAWTNRLRKRAIDGQGCPYCSGKKICQSNSLRALHPDLASQWDGKRNEDEGIRLTPETISPGAHDHVWWRCEFGHSWKAQVKQRSSLKTGCPKCRPNASALELRIACEVEAALGFEVVQGSKIQGIEADVLLPAFRVVVEIDGYPWHSPAWRKDAVERDERKTRRLQGLGYSVLRLRERRLPMLAECPCVLYDDGEDELKTCKAVVGALGALPEVGRETAGPVAEYLRRRSVAAEEKFLDLFARLNRPKPSESLAELHPQLVKEWCGEKNQPLTPDLVKPGSQVKVWWRCGVCTNEWRAVVASRTTLDTGCPRCSGRVFTPGRTFADLFPQLAAEWDAAANEVGADEVTPFSGTPRAWRCARGHSWTTSVANRTRGGTGCPSCSHKRASPEWNLLVAFPAVAALFDREANSPLEPQLVLPNAGKSKMLWWKCPSGHRWRDSADRQTRRGARCLYCLGTARRPAGP